MHYTSHRRRSRHNNSRLPRRTNARQPSRFSPVFAPDTQQWEAATAGNGDGKGAAGVWALLASSPAEPPPTGLMLFWISCLTQDLWEAACRRWLWDRRSRCVGLAGLIAGRAASHRIDVVLDLVPDTRLWEAACRRWRWDWRSRCVGLAGLIAGRAASHRMMLFWISGLTPGCGRRLAGDGDGTGAAGVWALLASSPAEPPPTGLMLFWISCLASDCGRRLAGDSDGTGAAGVWALLTSSPAEPPPTGLMLFWISGLTPDCGRRLAGDSDGTGAAGVWALLASSPAEPPPTGLMLFWISGLASDCGSPDSPVSPFTPMAWRDRTHRAKRPGRCSGHNAHRTAGRIPGRWRRANPAAPSRETRAAAQSHRPRPD